MVSGFGLELVAASAAVAARCVSPLIDIVSNKYWKVCARVHFTRGCGVLYDMRVSSRVRKRRLARALHHWFMRDDCAWVTRFVKRWWLVVAFRLRPRRSKRACSLGDEAKTLVPPRRARAPSGGGKTHANQRNVLAQSIRPGRSA